MGGQEQHLLELEAEARGCAVLQDDEGRTIRQERAALLAQMREGEARMEYCDVLPDLWADIYGAGPGFVSLFAGRRPSPEGRLAQPIREAYFAWPSETAKALAWIERQAEDDLELYQCCHLTRRWRRRKEDAAALHSLYVDLDQTLPVEPILPPSIVIESSPGRHQLYYRLTRPVAPLEGEQLNRRLALALRADASGWDLTQLLRVPGSVNHKYAERPLVRLVEQRSARYDARELSSFLPRLAPPTRRAEPHTRGEVPLRAGTGEPPVKLTRSGLALWRGELTPQTPEGLTDRSASLVRIARMLHQAGVPRDLIVASLAERDETLGWRKFTDRPDAVRHYHAIVDVVEQGARTGRR